MINAALAHDSPIFNIHDLILIMAAVQYLLLAVLLLATRRKGDSSAAYLSLILVVSAIQAIDTLLIWSHSVRAIILSVNSNLIFLGTPVYFLIGPLLLFYVRSVLGYSARPKRLDIVHLLPMLLMQLVLLFEYHLMPAETQREMMSGLAFIWSFLMNSAKTCWLLSVLIYGLWCLYLLQQYRLQLRERYANLEKRERSWLLWVVVGFMLIASWKLTVHIVSYHLEYALANALGTVTIYLNYIFVNSLVFVSIRYAKLFSDPQVQADGGAEPATFKDEHIDRIVSFMESEKPYLETDINIERLAKRISLPERTLSRILNKHFEKNFFEFINSYRIEVAKDLLTNTETVELPIIDVLYRSGFTSKSSFNSIFKKQLGLTPSQYRSQFKQS